MTKDHFYHNGGNIENRRTIVEALVCNFNTDHFDIHNHGVEKLAKTRQLTFQLPIDDLVVQKV